MWELSPLIIMDSLIFHLENNGKPQRLSFVKQKKAISRVATVSIVVALIAITSSWNLPRIFVRQTDKHFFDK